MRRRALAALAVFVACAGGLTTAAPAGACPADDADPSVPQSARDHICGAWDAAVANGANPGTALNSTHTWGNGYIRDFDHGALGRGGILERHGSGWAYVVGASYWQTYAAVGGAPGPLGFPAGRHEWAGHLNPGPKANEYMTFERGVINKWSAGTFATWGAILDRWNHSCVAPAQCGVLGPLGRPLSNEGDSAVGPHHSTPGRYSRFEGGVINHSRHGTFQVIGGIGRRYAQLGYSGSHLGLPIGEERGWHAGGRRQDFEGGYVYWHPGDDAGHADSDCPVERGDAPEGVAARMCSAWNSAGFANLGHPLGPAHRWGDGWIVDFDGGRSGRGGIMHGDAAGFAHVVGQPFWDALVAAGGAPRIGYPVGRGEFAAHLNDGPRETRYMTLSCCFINSWAGGTYTTYGAIRARWEAMGHVEGPVGRPIGHEGDTARVPGRFQEFEGGNLIWDPATGDTWHVYGGILAKYRELGYSAHPLGLPASDRDVGPRENEYQVFQGGVINQYGGRAFETHGAILERWNRSCSGGGRCGVGGPLGLPITDEGATLPSPTGAAGRFSAFEGGVINYVPHLDRAFVITGAVLDAYRRLGYSSSYLGLPTSEEHDVDGGRRQDFEGGYIEWRPGWPGARADREPSPDDDIAEVSLVDDPPEATDGGGASGGVTWPVSADPEFVFRGMGDSVTAGFGYRADGEPVSAAGLLPECREQPSASHCQSPGVIAYPAQFATRRGLRPEQWRNHAMSGAEPRDWLPPEDFDGSGRYAVSDVTAGDPDVTALTLGANPLLAKFLAEEDTRCTYNPIEVSFLLCVRDELTRQRITARLGAVYRRLLRSPRNHLAIFTYHTVVPSTASTVPQRVIVLLTAVNGAIRQAVAGLPRDLANRVRLLSPGNRLEWLAHGCLNPIDPWIILGDLCIHPSASGLAQFAKALEGAEGDAKAPGASLSAPTVTPGPAPRAALTLRLREPAAVSVDVWASAPRAAAARAAPPLVSKSFATRAAGRRRIVLFASRQERELLRRGARRARRLRVRVTVADGAGNQRWFERSLRVRRSRKR